MPDSVYHEETTVDHTIDHGIEFSLSTLSGSSS